MNMHERQQTWTCYSLHLVISFLQLTVSASLDAEHDSTVRWYLSSQKQTSNSKATIHLMLNCSTLVTLGMGAWRTGAVWYLLNGISRTSPDVQLWNKCRRPHTLRSYISWCGQEKREYLGCCYVPSPSGSKLHRSKIVCFLVHFSNPMSDTQQALNKYLLMWCMVKLNAILLYVVVLLFFQHCQ